MFDLLLTRAVLFMLASHSINTGPRSRARPFTFMSACSRARLTARSDCAH